MNSNPFLSEMITMQRQPDDITPRHGRKPNQKMKAYLVMQYLLRHTDESHALDAPKICAYLEEIGIEAERRSIYTDIEEINKVLWMEENGCTLSEAEEDLKDETNRAIVYSTKQRGFYVQRRRHELLDVQLLAECINAAKFIPQRDVNRLADMVCELVSEADAKKIRNESLVVDRVKTLNKGVLYNISTLRDAMAAELDGAPHTPEKVSFYYLTHQINDLEKPVERRRKYVVSPYQLIIDNGNYYLLAFDDAKQDVRTFRVDRMKNVVRESDPRAGEDVFKKLDMKTYTQRVFAMYGGEMKRVQLRFINSLLDTVIDRFGTKDAHYAKADDRHFVVVADVEISDQFFSWLCGFGKRVKVETPDVAEAYTAHLNKIAKLYES